MKTSIHSSRRSFLSHGAAGLALLPALAHAAPFSPTHIPSPPPADANIQGTANLQNRLTLDTMINGEGPFHFVVDTGSDRSVVSTELAARLGLINKDDVIVQGISRALQARTVKLDEVSFGPITVHDLATPLLPNEWLGADGYLGLDAINGKRVTFDFQSQRISVSTTQHNVDYSVTSDVIVPVSGTSGRLKAADCAVAGVTATAFVDSGAQASIGNLALFRELAKIGATFDKDITIPVRGATGGEAIGHLTAVRDIRIGGLFFARNNLIIADLEVFDVWGLSKTPALFLGMNFLDKMSAFTIDYGLRQLRFKLAENDVRIASRV